MDLPLAGSDAPDAPRIELEFAAGNASLAPGQASGGPARAALTTDVAGLRLLVYELKQAREAMQQAAET